MTEKGPEYAVGDAVYFVNGSNPLVGYRVVDVNTHLHTVIAPGGKLEYRTHYTYRIAGRLPGQSTWDPAPTLAELKEAAPPRTRYGITRDAQFIYMRAEPQDLSTLDTLTTRLLSWIRKHNPKALESRDETAGKIVKTLSEGGVYVPREEGRALLSDGSTAREGDWIENHFTHTSARVVRLELHSYDPHKPEEEKVSAWLQVPDAADTILVLPEVLQRDYKSLTP